MIREELLAAWMTLAGRADDHDIDLVPLPVAGSTGQLKAGRDRQGNPHILVPAAPGSLVGSDQRSTAVQIARRELLVDGRRQLFLDLFCRSRQLEDVFERLAFEVCERIEKQPTEALAIPGRVLRRWRDLLEGKPRPLGEEAAAGLFGELHVLEECLKFDTARRIDHWQRDPQAVHDFRRGGAAIEVKSTTAREGRFVEIHGITQLEPPTGGVLHLAFLRLTTTGQGSTIADVVDRVAGAGADQAGVEKILEASGWDRWDPSPPRFSVTEERWYRVDRSFPRLTPQSMHDGALPDGVLRLRYSVDLTGPHPVPLSHADRLLALQAMAVA